MADTQEQSLSTITPVDGDYFRAVDDPGGSPASANVTGTALKAYLKTYNDTLYYGTANVSYVSSNFSKTSDTKLANITGLTFTTASGGQVPLPRQPVPKLRRIGRGEGCHLRNEHGDKDSVPHLFAHGDCVRGRGEHGAWRGLWHDCGSRIGRDRGLH